MSTVSNNIVEILFGLAAIIILILVIRWCYIDANRRGKPPALVILAVLFFFPWGLIAWLLFRPEPAAEKKEFNLNDYQQQ